MAKTRPKRSSRSSHRAKSKLASASAESRAPSKTSGSDPATLLIQALELLQSGQPEAALPLAQRAVSALSPEGRPSVSTLPALSLLGEIQIELGDPDSALLAFQTAASIDPEGQVPEDQGGGAEKFLWLAQLCEDGGRTSLSWFERGVTVLERDIGTLEGQKAQQAQEDLQDRRRKLTSALCGMVEIWMTDLSLEPEAEQMCESLIARAMLVSPNPPPSTLQTLASIRLSQSRLEEAQSALTRSLDAWKDLPAEHVDVPDFPTRISLARLLMEAEMEESALDVVERLVGDDDQSVEAWYLGGWCLYLMAGTGEDEEGKPLDNPHDAQKTLLLSSREWLRNCVKLYDLLHYEDERLKEHAIELIQDLDQQLGNQEIDDEDDEDDGWYDEEERDGSEGNDNEDHEMNGT